MLEYARWKYVLIAVVLVAGLILALPNVFGSKPALQLAHKDHTPITAAEEASVAQYLKQHGVRFERTYIDSAGALMVQFADVPDQLEGSDAARAKYHGTYISALALVSPIALEGCFRCSPRRASVPPPGPKREVLKQLSR